uniref:Uncharacterized protein n=1 Tax=Cacopsylla melanoneura TaxID=428564 RepID=A0A8D8WEG8_9HEMI
MNQDIVNGAFLFRVLLKVINKKGNVSFWIYKVYIQGVYKFGSIKMEALFYAYRSMSNPLLITSNFSMGGKTACLIYHQSKEPHSPHKKKKKFEFQVLMISYILNRGSLLLNAENKII